jgi:hypothetical protein
MGGNDITPTGTDMPCTITTVTSLIDEPKSATASRSRMTAVPNVDWLKAGAREARDQPLVMAHVQIWGLYQGLFEDGGEL